ncbi:hypothetical protein [Rhodococcus sp. X156]|uniref:DUF7144 family membrane protein n=1 Tax=Rhodococcus sp. X156 TaxID=2499145 RepID=UPI000FD81552|nr:hypothetical protein [Rhodococcus sp. X156]
MAAAVLLVAVGILQFLQGLSALADDDILIVGPEYVYTLDTTAWGWIHLIVGALLAITGFCLFTGATWARVVAIFIAAISIIANFLWLPYYPVWSIVLIAIDVVIIWAVATWNTDDGSTSY